MIHIRVEYGYIMVIYCYIICIWGIHGHTGFIRDQRHGRGAWGIYIYIGYIYIGRPATGPPRQATGPPRAGAEAGVGLLRGAADSLK